MWVRQGLSGRSACQGGRVGVKVCEGKCQCVVRKGKFEGSARVW